MFPLHLPHSSSSRLPLPGGAAPKGQARRKDPRGLRHPRTLPAQHPGAPGKGPGPLPGQGALPPLSLRNRFHRRGDRPRPLPQDLQGEGGGEQGGGTPRDGENPSEARAGKGGTLPLPDGAGQARLGAGAPPAEGGGLRPGERRRDIRHGVILFFQAFFRMRNSS